MYYSAWIKSEWPTPPGLTFSSRSKFPPKPTGDRDADRIALIKWAWKTAASMVNDSEAYDHLAPKERHRLIDAKAKRLWAEEEGRNQLKQLLYPNLKELSQKDQCRALSFLFELKRSKEYN